jgi:hypothetical protein
MTVDEIRERVNAIKKIKGDPEAAHGSEDTLFSDVLAAIAKGRCSDPAACAREALRSNYIRFPRWSA